MDSVSTFVLASKNGVAPEVDVVDAGGGDLVEVPLSNHVGKLDLNSHSVDCLNTNVVDDNVVLGDGVGSGLPLAGLGDGGGGLALGVGGRDVLRLGSASILSGSGEGEGLASEVASEVLLEEGPAGDSSGERVSRSSHVREALGLGSVLVVGETGIDVSLDLGGEVGVVGDL